MAERLYRRQDDDRSARSPDPSLRYHRNRKRQLALQEPRRRSPNNPRSRRLRNPHQLRRRERYRPDSSNKGVKIGRRSGVKFASRLTIATALRVNASASSSSRAWIASVALLRAPFGRPLGLPLCPGSNGRPRGFIPCAPAPELWSNEES